MKTTSTVWAVAVLVTTAAGARAQSSVTIFGLVDLSARSVTTGDHTVRQLGTDGNSFSRLGFKVDEDLGGGLRAGPGSRARSTRTQAASMSRGSSGIAARP